MSARWAGLLLGAALFGAHPAWADAPDAGLPGPALPARDPAEAKRLLSAEQAKLNALVNTQQSLLDTLDAASAAIQAADVRARRAEVAERRAQAALAQANAAQDIAQAALDARLDALRPRLAARYRLDHGGAAALLLSSASLSDLLWRRRTLTRILSSDLALVRDAKVERARVRDAQRASARAEAALRDAANDRRRELLNARAKRSEMAAMLQALGTQRTAKEALVRELGEAARRVDALAVAHVAFDAHVPFEQLKGKLPPPVAGQVEEGFGRVVDAQFKTVLMHKGVDLRAPEGAVVHAVAAGRVVHAAAHPGYGNLVIVDQGQGYFTLYAHLQAIEHAVGDALSAGGRVGAVGATGSLKGPYLYFEIRHHGTALDPGDWIKK